MRWGDVLHMSVLGVDLSTKAVTAFHLSWEAEPLHIWHCEMKGKKALERLRSAYDVIGMIPWEKPSIICFERPAGKGTAAVMDIWRVQGFIIGCGWILEETIIEEMGPTKWKKLAGLPGNAGKEEIKQFALKQMRTDHLGDENGRSQPQDVYDAYCIALAALNFNKKGL